MRVEDIVPIWRLKRFWDWSWGRRGNRRTPSIEINWPTTHVHLIRDIGALSEDWHGAGVCGLPPLRAIALYTQNRPVTHTAETGVGKSTLLLSHISQHHTVFTLEDTGTTDSLAKVRASSLLNRGAVEFVVGPTQVTLPRHTFRNRLQLVLIDGPHAYPFPELEYYFFYPQLDEGGLRSSTISTSRPSFAYSLFSGKSACSTSSA